MREIRFRRWHCLLTGLMFALLEAGAQDNPARQTPATPDSNPSQASIADAARRSKAQSKHAKKVVTDDDLDTAAGPLPRLKLYGLENSQEVVAALMNYRNSHTPAQTEAVLRAWYEHYEQINEAVIKQNDNVRAVQSANLSNEIDLCQGGQEPDQYEACQKRRIAEQRGARSEQVTVSDNFALQQRIQHALLSLKTVLQNAGVRYDWFKIRSQNGTDM